MLKVPSKALGSAVEGKVWGCRVWVKRPGVLVCGLGFRVGGYGHGKELGKHWNSFGVSAGLL